MTENTRCTTGSIPVGTAKKPQLNRASLTPKNRKQTASRVGSNDPAFSAPQILCRRCGKRYPPTREHWYFKDGRLGKPCKECYKQNSRDYLHRKGVKPIAPRLCRYCGEMFTPTTKHANRRKHCYRPECIIQAHRQYDAQKRAATAAWRVKNGHKESERWKVCPLCGYKRMPEHYHFCCNECRRQAGNCDGDHIYVSMEV